MSRNENSDRRLIPKEDRLTIILNIIVTAGAVLSGAFTIAAHLYLTPLSPSTPPQTLDQRIEQLTKSLSTAYKTISDIEFEIDQRKKLAENLKQDADQAQKLKNINSEQVNAISQALRVQLQEESKSGLYATVGANIFFAFLGALFGEIIRIGRNLYASRKQRKAGR